MSKDWDVYNCETCNHVIPHDDENEHILHEDCLCNPKYSEGKGGWAIYAHQAYDRREILERIENVLLP